MLFAGIPLADALFVPIRYKAGATLLERIRSINRIADPLLGVDRSKGEMAYIHPQGQEWLFVSKDRLATIFHPTGTPMQHRPRYHWIDDPAGIRRGYLMESAAGPARAGGPRPPSY